MLQKDIPLDLRVFGNVEPIASIAVKAQVGGDLIEVNFEEGQEVKKGDLLFTIQPRLYATQLAQAEANLERDRALALNASNDLERYRLLDAKGAVVRWYGTTTDIDDSKVREGRIRSLVAEVNHRSRNLLAWSATALGG